MRKIIILFLVVPLLFAYSCSSDENDGSKSATELIGRYISDDAGIEEIFTLDLNENIANWKFYDKRLIYGEQTFKWSVKSSKFVSEYQNGETEVANYRFKDNTLFLGDVIYRKVPSESFASLVGHVFVAADWIPSTHAQSYIVYEFKVDGTFSIEKRKEEINGVSYETDTGEYIDNNGTLDLKTPSVGGPSNSITAILHNDKKSFTYEKYDLSIGEFRTLFFYAIK